MKKITSILAALTACFGISAQEIPEKGYFGPPMQIPLEVSGTFCELRSNHFHFGMDFRTAGTDNIPLYACADGYVYRIKVSYFGYGKSIYIKHKNGFITLYGHLKNYAPLVKSRVTQEQSRNQDYEFDIYLDSTEIPVKKGDLLAYSGNTGSSQGAHLHFEFRDSTNTVSFNPLLFGLEVKDTRKPVFTGVSIYTGNSGGSFSRKDYAVLTGKSGYYFKNGSTIQVSDVFRIGCQVTDKQDATNYKNGVHSLEMLVNGERRFYVEYKELAFEESRFINSYTDYKEYIKSKTFIQRCFIDPCNTMRGYDHAVGDGTFWPEPGETYQVTLIASDFAGNTSTLNFNVQLDNSVLDEFTPSQITENTVLCQSEKSISRDFGVVTFPVTSLYESLEVDFTRGTSLNAYGYPDYMLNNYYIPIHRNIQLALKINPENPVPEDKLGLVYYNPSGKKTFYGGEVLNGWLICETNDLGVYTIMADTVPPVITGAADNSTLKSVKYLTFGISDNFSGINRYDVYVDDEWILGEYEWKDKAIYVETVAIPSGWHTWKVVVTDYRNNRAERVFRYQSP